MYVAMVMVSCLSRVGELLEVFSSLDKAAKEKEREENQQQSEGGDSDGGREGREGSHSPLPSPDNEASSTDTVRQR